MTTETELFGLRSLNGKIEAFGADAIRTRVATNKFALGRTLVAEDGTAEWDEVTFDRGLAPVVGHDSPFPLRQNLAVINRRSAVAHIKESKVIPARKLYYEREAGGLRPNAMAVIEQELADLTNRIAATREYMAWETLRGTLTVNATNIPGTTTPFTISYTTNAFASAADWDTAGTAILSSEIPALRQDFEQASGMVPAQVLCGSTVEGFLVANTEISSFLVNQLGPQILTTAGATMGPMLGGIRIGGLQWEIVEGGYDIGAGFVRYLPTTDESITLPADNMLGDVLGVSEGRGFIPQSDIVTDAAASAQVANMVRPAPNLGFYSYATRVSDPAGVKLYAGWVGLPVLLRPIAVQVTNLVA